MESFFNWLSSPGPMEEIVVCIVIFFICFFVYFLVRSIKFSIGKQGIRIESKEEASSSNDSEKSKLPKVEKENIATEPKSPPKNDKKIDGVKISVTACQDYKVISLILDLHNNRVVDEMRVYCTKNGLDKKDRDEYMMYVDEKKNLYMSELKEIINREYTSYDILSLTDIYQILDECKETLMNKLEKLYIKVRDISITEHRRINEERNILYNEFNEKVSILINKDSMSRDEIIDEFRSLLKKLATNIENLTLDERVNILSKQMQKITISKKEMIDILLTKIISKLSDTLSYFRYTDTIKES